MAKELQNNSRYLNLDVCRIIACFAVILLHCSCKIHLGSDIHTRGWLISTGFDCAARFAVPMFVMISGAFFLPSTKQICIGDIPVRVNRIFKAFCFWAVVYIMYDSLKAYVKFGEYPRFNILAKTFIEGGEYHLWFCWLIIGLYIITPILRIIVENEKILKYFLVIWFLSNIIYLIPQLSKVALYMQLNSISGYIGYYLLGHYLNNVVSINSFNKFRRGRVLLSIAFASLVFTILMTILLSFNTGSVSARFNSELAPNVILLTSSLFLYIKSKYSYTYIPKTIPKLLIDCNFGVYLIHVFILDIFDRIIYWSPAIFSIPLTVIIVFVVSYIFVYFLRKIPFLKSVM